MIYSKRASYMQNIAWNFLRIWFVFEEIYEQQGIYRRNDDLIKTRNFMQIFRILNLLRVPHYKGS